ILAVDHSGKIIKANQKFADLWGIPRSIIDSGDDNTMLNSVIDQLIDPGAFINKVKHLYGTTDIDEDVLLFKDGRVFERYSAPLIREGNVIGRVRSFRDVTGRKKAEEVMHTLSTAVKQSSDWILITDISGKIEYVNDAVERITGYTREEILGKTPRILKSGRHDTDFYKKMWDTILSGQTFTGILTNRKKSGELFEVYHTITPIKDNKGF